MARVGTLESRRGSLRIVEVDDARPVAGELFRRAFRAEVPDFPRHFVLLKGEGGDAPCLGYVHYTRHGTAWLAGGLVVAAMEFRRLDPATAASVREAGGLAEWLMATTCGWLDGDAAFAYMGDAKSITVNTRVGFRFTGEKHLYVLWKRDLPAAEAQRVVESVRVLGPF